MATPAVWRTSPLSTSHRSDFGSQRSGCNRPRIRSMKSVTVRNYRCFGDNAQTAKLAPLTLFVGENSSGKTSLMAMLRALWDAAIDDRVPDFKEAPYDLGSFNEIAHHRGARGSRAESFEGRFEAQLPRRRSLSNNRSSLEFRVTFGEQWSAPSPVNRRFSCDGYWVTQFWHDGEGEQAEIGSPLGKWRLNMGRRSIDSRLGRPTVPIWPIDRLLFNLRMSIERERGGLEVEALEGSPDLTSSDIIALSKRFQILQPRIGRSLRGPTSRPFATAPVRSQPERTYDPRRSTADALGDYVPTYLAQLSQRDNQAWSILKARLQKFGHDAGLFDEIRVRHLGKTDVDPFQLQVRKFGTSTKGPFRSLVDVGYGISQVLPVALELLRDDGPRTLLLQQPEVHLHPSAQASLGTLLCEVAGNTRTSANRQLIVETHSDHIIDRVRMAVADPSQAIKPEDVSLVYFERSGLEVLLHSISVDELGNVVDAPPGYRQFFLDEIQRSVGF